jgi:hypothetical protein
MDTCTYRVHKFFKIERMFIIWDGHEPSMGSCQHNNGERTPSIG